jgi:four helix bundle protein
MLIFGSVFAFKLFMSERSNKHYDLEFRTLVFTRTVIEFINKLPRTLTNIEIGKQLIRSAGSVGANYIEANEALSKKDFIMRIKISRKEAKESRYWLSLTNPVADFNEEKSALIKESTELMNIFGAILRKSTS